MSTILQKGVDPHAQTPPTKGSILVTGAPGTVGNKLVERFVADGYDVRAISKDRWVDPPVESYLVDLRDLGQTVDAVAGYETVIHLAAHSRPFVSRGQVFSDNLMSAFNVFWAAKLQGVKRVVWASSSHSGGQPFSIESLAEYPPAVFPIVENHQYQAGDIYGLSKLAAESLLPHTRFWGDTEIVGLRMGFAYEVENYEFLYEADFPRVQANPEERIANLWNYVDGRDVYQAFKKAVDSTGNIGGEIMHIHAADTMMDIPTRELMAKYAPKVVVPEDLPEYGSAYSIARARKILGYEPQYSWRDVLG
ncbi:MAG: NAD(P)-dependent oxidoreductase [Candidatus Leucobacter sulfamidivorax]|nr:NAD(P)-dependent oxidoreductase [Candidatus Leucobacter sulfamidivorax]